MKQKAFVTGATGFIGNNLVRLLINEGWKVCCLYREGSNRNLLRTMPIQWKKGSLSDRRSLADAIPDDTGVVFHLAGDTNLWAKNNARQTAINVDGTRHLIHASIQHKVPVFIHTSSVAAWGDITGEVTEQRKQHGNESWINYERTKWAGEREALQGLNHGMKVVVLSPTNVIGPHDKNNWGRLFTALRDNKLPFVADGCVSVAHVEHVAHAHLTAITKAKSGERYILGGRHRLFSEFVGCINEVSGAKNMPAVIPSSLFRGYAQLSSRMASLFNNQPVLTPELAHLMTRKDVKYISQKARDELDYSIPPMRKSVQDCYRWLKAQHLL